MRNHNGAASARRTVNNVMAAGAAAKLAAANHTSALLPLPAFGWSSFLVTHGDLWLLSLLPGLASHLIKASSGAIRAAG